nr:MAG TPA: hypothetical protein [Caudoviricetes sp.]
MRRIAILSWWCAVRVDVPICVEKDVRNVWVQKKPESRGVTSRTNAKSNRRCLGHHKSTNKFRMVQEGDSFLPCKLNFYKNFSAD